MLYLFLFLSLLPSFKNERDASPPPPPSCTAVSGPSVSTDALQGALTCAHQADPERVPLSLSACLPALMSRVLLHVVAAARSRSQYVKCVQGQAYPRSALSELLSPLLYEASPSQHAELSHIHAVQGNRPVLMGFLFLTLICLAEY